MGDKRNYYAIIPGNVRYDLDLKANEKLLYGEITALCNDKGFCWAGNSYFSELYGVANETVSRWITSLINKRYIKRVIEYEDDGKTIKRRLLYVVDEKINTPRQNNQEAIDEKVKGVLTKKSIPIDEKVKENNTINNTINNTFNNMHINEGDSNFEKLWELYPNKKGKSKARTAYLKAIKDGVDNKTIQDGILAYKQEIQLKGTSPQYIAHGSTWFNQRRWEDDYSNSGKVVSQAFVADAPTNPDEVEYSDEDRYWYEKYMKEHGDEHASD